MKFACRKCGELLTKELKIELLKLRETLDNFGEDLLPRGNAYRVINLVMVSGLLILRILLR